jgi:hypothetical protein
LRRAATTLACLEQVECLRQIRAKRIAGNLSRFLRWQLSKVSNLASYCANRRPKCPPTSFKSSAFQQVLHWLNYLRCALTGLSGAHCYVE